MNSFGRKNGEENEKLPIFTKELAGMVLILFSALTMVCLITRETVFSSIGQYINYFLLGVFGYTAYFWVLFVGICGVMLVADKKMKFSSKALPVIFATITAVLLAHAISVRKVAVTDFSKYLSDTYAMAEKGITTSSFGGAISSIITFFPVKIISLAGTYAVLGVLCALSIYFSIKGLLNQSAEPKKKRFKKETADADMAFKDYPVDGVVPEDDKTGGLFVRSDDFELKTKKEIIAAEKKSESFKILYPNRKGEKKGLGYGASETATTPLKTDDFSKKLDYIKIPTQVQIPDYDITSSRISNSTANTASGQVRISEPIRSTDVERGGALPPMFEHDESDTIKDEPVKRRIEDYDRYAGIEEVDGGDTSIPVTSQRTAFEPPILNETVSESRDEVRNERIIEEQPVNRTPFEFTDEDINGVSSVSETDEPARTNVPLFGRSRGTFEPVEPTPISEENVEKESDTFARNEELPQRQTFVSRESLNSNEIISGTHIQEEKEEPKEFVPMINRVYNKPPLDLFKVYKQDINAQREDHEERAGIIERTLSEFGIDAKVVNYVQGPTVTRYEIMMPPGVSVKKVPNHADDIAMRLESENGVRIEAPIPGKNLVGIEVPNKVKAMVGLRDIIESPNFQKDKAGALMFALGKDIVGNAVSDNLAKGPHYLVAGSTGMGKSVGLNSMIISLISKYSPEELRIILIDPKQVEFTVYNHLPHLMIDEIITNAQKAIATLQWAVDEMEARYSKFKENEVKDIDEYNEEIASDTVPKIPKLVIIVDEVSDLMQYNKRDLEAKILSLSQKARAAGIHLVLATQRPSVDVITGVIKANLPSRIAFRVSNAMDSMTILAEGGAEKLLGNGDMLYRTATMPKCERIQGSFISNAEVKSIVNYIKEHNEAYFNDKAAAEIENAIKPQTPEPEENAGGEVLERNLGEDKLFIEALRKVVTVGSASISMLQRSFSVGYAKAGQLIDKMDRLGYVSPFDGAKARQVLITKEEFEKKYGEL